MGAGALTFAGPDLRADDAGPVAGSDGLELPRSRQGKNTRPPPGSSGIRGLAIWILGRELSWSPYGWGTQRASAIII